MNTGHIIAELARNKTVFRTLLEGLPPEVFLWKQNPDKWCLLEIVCHLHDEEREDFRTRVRHTLETPDRPAPSIDPVGWVTARKYIEQDYAPALDKFLNEREESVRWLKTLVHPRWENIYRHPSLGDLSARMFLVNWLAHDYLHIRQITRLKYDYLKNSSGESLAYAGTW